MKAKNKRAIGGFVIALLLTATLPGCGSKGQVTLGRSSEGAKMVAIRDVVPSSGLIALHGTMVEKCPVAFCWFRLRDKTGEIKVDLKGTDFTVADTPLNTEVIIYGKPVKAQDSVILAATGMRY